MGWQGANLLLGKLISKEKESSIYPGFLIWTELLINHNLDKRKYLLLLRKSSTNSWKENYELKRITILQSHWRNRSRHWAWLVANIQKEESASNYVPPDVSPTALPKKLNLNLNKPLNSCEGNSEDRRTIPQHNRPPFLPYMPLILDNIFF